MANFIHIRHLLVDFIRGISRLFVCEVGHAAAIAHLIREAPHFARAPCRSDYNIGIHGSRVLAFGRPH